ncbi:MAG: hypothetical protein Q6373_006585 [Candidatus Sigynarchaeota archaeon]
MSTYQKYWIKRLVIIGMVLSGAIGAILALCLYKMVYERWEYLIPIIFVSVLGTLACIFVYRSTVKVLQATG